MGLHHLQSGALQNHLGIDAYRGCRCHGFASGHGFYDLGDRRRTLCNRLFGCSCPFFEARLVFAHLCQVHLAFPRAQFLRIWRLREIVRDSQVGFMLCHGQARQRSLLAGVLRSAITSIAVAPTSAPAALLIAFARDGCRGLAVARPLLLGLLRTRRALLLRALLVGTALAALAVVALRLSAVALLGATFAALLRTALATLARAVFVARTVTAVVAA